MSYCVIDALVFLLLNGLDISLSAFIYRGLP